MIMRQITPSTRRAVLYGRTSTDGQDDKTSLGAQLDYMRRNANETGVEVVLELTEVASGGTAERPELQSLMEFATNKENRIDTVLVYDLSRFSRNPEDFFDLYGTLKRHNIQLRSVIEPHMGDEMSELLYAIITIFNSVLLPRIARLVRRGQFKSTEAGYWVAKEIPLGYQKYYVQDGKQQHAKLEPNPETWHPARRVWDLLLENRSGGEVGKILNREGFRTSKGNRFKGETILDMARNEAYLGHVVRGKNSRTKYLKQDETARCDNAHQAMVTQEEWDRVQEFIANRTREASGPRTHSSPFLFSGKALCGKSGKPMHVHRSNENYPKLICKEKRDFGKEVCPCENVDMHQLHKLIMSDVLYKTLTRKTLVGQVQLAGEQHASFVGEEEAKDKAAGKRINAIKRGKKNLLDSLEAYGPHENIGVRMDELTKEEADLERERAIRQEHMRTRAAFVNEPERIIRNALDMRTYLKSDDPHTVREFVNIFVEKLTIEDGEVTVKYRIPVPSRDGDGLVEQERLSLRDPECVLGVPIGIGAPCWTPSTWIDFLLLGIFPPTGALSAPRGSFGYVEPSRDTGYNHSSYRDQVYGEELQWHSSDCTRVMTVFPTWKSWRWIRRRT